MGAKFLHSDRKVRSWLIVILVVLHFSIFTPICFNSEYTSIFKLILNYVYAIFTVSKEDDTVILLL